MQHYRVSIKGRSSLQRKSPTSRSSSPILSSFPRFSQVYNRLWKTTLSFKSLSNLCTFQPPRNAPYRICTASCGSPISLRCCTSTTRVREYHRTASTLCHACLSWFPSSGPLRTTRCLQFHRADLQPNRHAALHHQQDNGSSYHYPTEVCQDEHDPWQFWRIDNADYDFQRGSSSESKRW